MVRLRAVAAHMWNFKFVAALGMVTVSAIAFAPDQPAAALALAYTGGMMMSDWISDIHVSGLVKLMKDLASACDQQSAIIKEQQTRLDALHKTIDGIVGRKG